MDNIDPDLFKFNVEQIDAIINRVVPLIAAQEDHEFFKGILHIKADSCKSSGEFGAFVANLLKNDKRN